MSMTLIAVLIGLIPLIAIVQTAIQTADAARSLKRIEKMLEDRERS